MKKRFRVCVYVTSEKDIRGGINTCNRRRDILHTTDKPHRPRHIRRKQLCARRCCKRTNPLGNLKFKTPFSSQNRPTLVELQIYKKENLKNGRVTATGRGNK